MRLWSRLTQPADTDFAATIVVLIAETGKGDLTGGSHAKREPKGTLVGDRDDGVHGRPS